MTPAQLSTLAANINATPALAPAVAAKDWPTIAAYYNALTSPVVTVWRADVRAAEVTAAIDYAEYVVLTAIKQNGLQLLVTAGTLDATSATVRAAFTAIFAAGNSRTALNAIAIRTATRFEALFAGAAISGSVVSQVYGQTLSAADVQTAMGG